jgi:hypothetical protein
MVARGRFAGAREWASLHGGLQLPIKEVSEEGFIDVLNGELRKEKDFEEGMRFMPHPQDATGANITGYTWKGRW